MSVDLTQYANLIVSLATLATACNAIRVSNRHDRNSDKRKIQLTKTVEDESHKVQLATNGIVDKLVQSTAKSSKAEGVLEEKEKHAP